MEILKAHGDYPQIVYRAFENIEYAKAFIKGTIKFSLLESYKKIEDTKRQDATEGDAYIVYNDTHYHSSFASNRFYILCFHRSLKAAQQSEFGEFIVKITNPKTISYKNNKMARTTKF